MNIECEHRGKQMKLLIDAEEVFALTYLDREGLSLT